jgi:hypothetical protein
MNYFTSMLFKLIGSFAILTCVTQTLFAQTLSQSPYGRFALGDQIGTSAPQLNALGGTFTTLTDSNSLNIYQPASLTSISRSGVIFEAGFNGVTTQYQTANSQLIGRTAGFGYFSLGFPLIKNRWFAAINLSPITNSGFTLRDSLINQPEGTVRFSYRGTGGFSSFGFTNSIQLFKGFSIGIQANYIFGKNNYFSEVAFPNDANIRNSRITNSFQLSDVSLNTGVLYQINFKKPKDKFKIERDSTGKTIREVKISRDSLQLQLGATYAPATTINGNYTYLSETFFGNGQFTTDFIDTSLYINQQKGNVKMPMRASAGFTLKNCYNSLLFSADVQYTDWNNFKIFDRIDSVHSSTRFSGGLQWIPKSEKKFTNKTNYFNRVRYRLGGYYSTGALKINGASVPEMGVSVGFGLPITLRTYGNRSATSLLNFAIIAGQRGQKNANLLVEKFVRLSIGFSLNDKWFNKYKYD